MKISILAFGNRMPEWVDAGVAEYMRRMPPELRVTLTELRPDRRTAGRSTEQILAAERDRVRDALPPRSRTIVLDERGLEWTTVQLSRLLRDSLDLDEDLSFVIGGADGLHGDVKALARPLVSLSRLTLPHGLARVILAEQLYRAASILHNHPYHRE